MQVRLNERQQQVLWATVRHYIATAEPVGSKALAEEYNLKVSAATIRNIMGALEQGGLLYQPHTSAGRVPSDSGYRIYVDYLMTPANDLSRRVEQLLSDRLNPTSISLEAVLRGAAQILATLSGYITLITLPQTLTATIRWLQLVRVETSRVMLIVVTDNYETRSALMELGDTADTEESRIERELEVLTNFLNHQLRGRSLTELANLDWQQLDREFQRHGDTLRTLLQDLLQRSQPVGSNQILISGLSEVLQQPEFSQLQQVQTILHLLEDEQDQLWPLICEWSVATDAAPITLPSQQRVRILIGSENPLEPMRMCTLVSSTYQRGSVPIGSVGVLGPTRMPYDKVIPLVEATADYLSDTLGQPA
uniref:Heat-inducible transcription repressor HrcA n=1 Tax=Cyanothece sp. (strain PCC 7425 / ATCC 29141) TaxID=395961 RepID=HRCA_CYAP4|nr:RecName: Full=Heat-inducible transcription repressor HrcA [Cyanothece sp. PCC 7425]